MKNIQKYWVQGSTKIIQGLARKFGLALLGGAVAVALWQPISVKAAPPITQLEFIQWLVQVTGESSQLPASAGVADYIQWAQSKGITPAGGWKPGAALTKQTLAQALVQLLNLSSTSKDGNDYERILAREGIALPDESTVSRGRLVDVLGGSDIAPRISSGAGSPVKRPNNGFGNGDQPPPPHNPNGNPHTNPPGNSGNAPGHN